MGTNLLPGFSTPSLSMEFPQEKCSLSNVLWLSLTHLRWSVKATKCSDTPLRPLKLNSMPVQLLMLSKLKEWQIWKWSASLKLKLNHPSTCSPLLEVLPSLPVDSTSSHVRTNKNQTNLLSFLNE